MNYVDWGGWLKWLIHGPDPTTPEIECGAVASVHLQKCEGGNGLYDAVHGRRERMFDRGRLYKPSCKSRREKVSVKNTTEKKLQTQKGK